MSAQAEIAAAITTADAVRASGKPHRRDGSIDCGASSAPRRVQTYDGGSFFAGGLSGFHHDCQIVEAPLPARFWKIARTVALIYR